MRILFLCLFTFLVYASSLKNGLVWDDHLFLEQWPAIEHFTNIPQMFQGAAPSSQDKVYRPLRSVFYIIDYKLWGNNPFWFHLQALLIHLAITVLVYLIAKKIFLNLKSSIINHKSVAFTVALLFGLHPIHSETINYISASMETFGTVFFFLAFYLYLLKDTIKDKTKKLSIYIISVVCSLLAFFTYEMTLTLPILIVLYKFCFHQKQRWIRIIPYFLAAAGYLFIRIVLLGIFGRTDYLAYSFYHTQLTMIKVFARYVLLLLLPLHQSAIHNLVGDFPASMIPYDKLDPVLNQTPFDIDFILSVILLLTIIVVAVKYYKHKPLLTFSIAWFFITLLPVSYIIPHGGAMAEKYLYIASFGFILGMVYFIFTVASPKGVVILNRIAMIVLVVLALFYSFLTFQRNSVWHDDISLFSDVVKNSPNNLMANYTLGIWYGRAKQFDLAQNHYQIALAKAPEFEEARYNLANIYLREGQLDTASDEFRTILKMNPKEDYIKDILDNIKLIKSSSPSAVFITDDDILVPFKMEGDLSFKYPIYWKLLHYVSSVSGSGINTKGIELIDPSGKFHISIEQDLTNINQKPEDYLKNQTEIYGKLVNQGLAKIPNLDMAFVKVFEDKDIKKLQFFLFYPPKVVKVLVYPADSPLMSIFEQIIESFKI